MDRKRVLITENCSASRAGSRTMMEPALSVLYRAGFDVDLRQPEGPGEMDQLLRREGPAASVLVVAGGDGTVHAALPALIECDRPFGILPFGTANDLALTLGIPADSVAAAQIIAAGHRRRIDIGSVNGVAFVNAASVGLAVKITRRMKDARKRHWGRLSYGLTALETLAEAEPFGAVVHCDGKRFELEAHQITVGNGVHFGGGMTVAEDAAIDDGVLDVFALETCSIPTLLALAPALHAGKLVDSEDVRTFRCRRLRIETDPAIKVSTDGEIATETPAEFAILPRAVEVLVPVA